MKTEINLEDYLTEKIKLLRKENNYFTVTNKNKEGWHLKTEISPGTFYSGNWENGKMCGEGKISFPDGTEFKAIWVNDKPKNISYIVDHKQAEKIKAKEEYLRNFEPSIFKNILWLLCFVSVVPIVSFTSDFLHSNNVPGFFVYLILIAEGILYIWLIATKVNWRLLGSD